MPLVRVPSHVTDLANVMMSEALHDFVAGPWWPRVNGNKYWE
jgi:hypothetical protein